MKTEKELIHEAALKNLKFIQQMWGKEHFFSSVDENYFRHLDLNFYKKTENAIVDLGFNKLGDIEDVDLKESKPDPRTFLRILSNSDATITAAIYHVKPKFPWPIFCWIAKLTPLKIFEFETEFENGIILTTTIETQLSSADSPKEIIQQHCDKNFTVEELYRTHKNKIQNIISEFKTKCVKNKTLDDICLSQNRAIWLRRKHMEEIGWVSKEYLIKLHKKDNKFINDLYDEIQRLVKKQLITGDIH